MDARPKRTTTGRRSSPVGGGIPRAARSRSTGALLVAAVAAFGVLVGATSAAGGTEPPRPRLLVLTLHDLPESFAPFEQAQGYVDDNARAARETGRTIAELETLGRVTGYHVGFDEKPQQVGSRILVGAFIRHVESEANLYRSPALARASFRAQVSEPPPRGMRFVKPKARVGQETVVLTQTTPDPYVQGGRDNLFYVYWRHGPVTASVLVVGLKETVHLPDAMALARKQQQKIAKSLR